ncbi:MAG: alpha-amylase [Planctomycetes bacterium B3_Pla]|nr:MAG: alpha-amylase [Planctomycetes bacterium B3_Pla]
MSFAEDVLSQARPDSVRGIACRPERQSYFPSPVDWRDQVLYFLLVDRFSDGREDTRPLLDKQNLEAARPGVPDGQPWRWDKWAASGAQRWQGGTLKGVQSKLGYLKQLGVTALWLSPVLRQRGHLDTYHGYGIQDFLDVDPRFGSRQDLVELVAAAHSEGLRVILDVVFNHSGSNWLYRSDTPGGVHEADYNSNGRYPFGAWRNGQGEPVPDIAAEEDGVWPTELQHQNCYTRAGTGDLGKGDIDDPNAEHKRSDFCDLREFDLDQPHLLSDLSRCYKYWIALTDCDGFRIDTLKHVAKEQARNFCGAIKEFAANLGKQNFFLVGEIAGGDYAQDLYLDSLDRNLTAVLDIGEMCPILSGVAKGLRSPRDYFDGFNPGDASMGSHRNLGQRHVSILDDHDHIYSEKVRFSSEASCDHQVISGTVLQLFTLGIPCIYYGTEQAFAGPEPSERKWLPDWKRSDRYLREAMFGPEHPRASGTDGLHNTDPDLPGFGPFGTAGHHCFDEHNPVYKRIAGAAAIRMKYPALRSGRQYLRCTSFLNRPFDVYSSGEIIAWSRILDDEELLCVMNTNGAEQRGADVIVDTNLSTDGNGTMTVVFNTAQAAATQEFAGPHPVGSAVPVNKTADGRAFVPIRDIPPAEVVVLANHP